MGAILFAQGEPQEKSGKAMLQAMQKFTATLSVKISLPKPRFGFDDAERLNWHFIPRERKGLPLRELEGERPQGRPGPDRQRPVEGGLRPGAQHHEPRRSAVPARTRRTGRTPRTTQSRASITSASSARRRRPANGAGAWKGITFRSITRSIKETCCQALPNSSGPTPPRSTPAPIGHPPVGDRRRPGAADPETVHA